MKPVKVFVSPRIVVHQGERTTALRMAMDEAGMGVWKVKAKSDVSHQTIAYLANGVRGVEKEMAKRIAAALDKPVGELFMHKDGAELVDA